VDLGTDILRRCGPDMLATFVIGLREGLEAALIVGIIAAFLRKNGKSLLSMWLGVALAVMLSLGVGVGLKLVERSLPQAAQEGMESVIGAIAIFFVTGMIVWMNAHARYLKRDLEAGAAEAVSQASTYALASMAFLAVLREGFETSVFLLATFSAAQSAGLAAAGAVVGLLLAVVIGWGIYIGGIKLNLSKFFRFTGAFLILVAAGLVITSLRTAHEAGWLNAGQQPTVDLSWLVGRGTVQSALITGVLGIPADPRLIEVLGWFAYLIPVTLFVYWPRSRRPGPQAAARLQLAIAAGIAAVAVGLVVLYPVPRPQGPGLATILATTGASQQALGTAHLRLAADGSPAVLVLSLDGSEAVSLPLPADGRRAELHEGIDAFAWDLTRTEVPAHVPATLSFDQVTALAGGRTPVGLNAHRNPGPFTADWSIQHNTSLWTAGALLLDAAERSTTILTLSGGGLQTRRTLKIDNGGADIPASGWQLSEAYRTQAAAEVNGLAAAGTERQFWAIRLPIALAVLALVLTLYAGRTVIRRQRGSQAAAAVSISKTGHRAGESAAKGVVHAAH
jgi:high-affinity iron transporter